MFFELAATQAGVALRGKRGPTWPGGLCLSIGGEASLSWDPWRGVIRKMTEISTELFIKTAIQGRGREGYRKKDRENQAKIWQFQSSGKTRGGVEHYDWGG